MVERKWTRAQLLAENKRIKELLLTWEPPQVAENLRRELNRLKQEACSREYSAIKDSAQALENVAIDFAMELGKFRAFQARKQAGLWGWIKRGYRAIRHSIREAKSEGGFPE